MDTSNSSHDSDEEPVRDEMGEQSPIELPTTDPAETSVAPMDMELPDCIPQDSSSYTYHSDTLVSQAFNKMKALRDSNLLCDVILVVGSKRISAHRLVLASTFDYFSSMFTQDMMEKSQSEIVIRDIDEDAVESLVNFAYTSELEITTNNVQYLLTASAILQMQSVLGACAEFLGEHLSSYNCLAIRNFAESHGCLSLVEQANMYFKTHFKECLKTDEFFQLPIDTLSELIDSDDLNVETEECVFEAIQAWVEHQSKNKPELVSKFSNLLRNVRLPLLNPTYLTSAVEKNRFIKTDLSCRDLMDEAKNFHLFAKTQQVVECTTKTYPRKSTAGKLYAIGGRGKAGDPFQSVERYDYHTDSWHEVTPLNSRRRHVGVAYMDRKIWAVGGHDGEVHLNTVEFYDPVINQWEYAAPMISYRRGIAVAALNNSDEKGPLYAIGGLDGTTCFTFVERYDPDMNEWTTVAPLITARGGVGVSTLDKFIYAAGGNDGTSSLMTVERFDPYYNKWTSQPPMSKRRAGIGLAELNGCLYAVGGFDDASPLDSVERYDPRMDKWEPIQSMSTARGGVGVASLGGCLFAVGGHNGKNYLNTVECYYPSTDVWVEISPMKTSRAGAGVVTCPTFAALLK